MYSEGSMTPNRLNTNTDTQTHHGKNAESQIQEENLESSKRKMTSLSRKPQ